MSKYEAPVAEAWIGSSTSQLFYENRLELPVEDLCPLAGGVPQYSLVLSEAIPTVYDALRLMNDHSFLVSWDWSPAGVMMDPTQFQ